MSMAGSERWREAGGGVFIIVIVTRVRGVSTDVGDVAFEDEGFI